MRAINLEIARNEAPPKPGRKTTNNQHVRFNDDDAFDDTV